MKFKKVFINSLTGERIELNEKAGIIDVILGPFNYFKMALYPQGVFCLILSILIFKYKIPFILFWTIIGSLAVESKRRSLINQGWVIDVIHQKQLDIKQSNLIYTSKFVESEEELEDSLNNPFLNFVSLDIETTGTNYEFDEIIEIAAIKYRNGQEVDKFHTLVKPNKRISIDATKINNITNSMVKNAPKIEEVIPQLFKFIHFDVVVSHYATFESNFLIREANKLNLLIEFGFIDTWKLSKISFPQLKDFSLKALVKYYNLDMMPNHRAYMDAKACAKIYLNLTNLCKVSDNVKILFDIIEFDHWKIKIKNDSIFCNNTYSSSFYYRDVELDIDFYDVNSTFEKKKGIKYYSFSFPRTGTLTMIESQKMKLLPIIISKYIFYRSITGSFYRYLERKKNYKKIKEIYLEPVILDEIDETAKYCFIVSNTKKWVNELFNNTTSYDDIRARLGDSLRNIGGKLYATRAKSAKFAIIVNIEHRNSLMINKLRNQGYKVTTLEKLMQHFNFLDNNTINIFVEADKVFIETLMDSFEIFDKQNYNFNLNEIEKLKTNSNR